MTPPMLHEALRKLLGAVGNTRMRLDVGLHEAFRKSYSVAPINRNDQDLLRELASFQAYRGLVDSGAFFWPKEFENQPASSSLNITSPSDIDGTDGSCIKGQLAKLKAPDASERTSANVSICNALASQHWSGQQQQNRRLQLI